MGEFPQWVLVGLGVAGFLITIIVTTGTVVWQAGNIRTELSANITSHKERLDGEVNGLKTDIASRFASAYMQMMQNIEAAKAQSVKDVAETLDQVRKVEIFIRDEFVRKETFNMVVERILNEVRTIGSNLEARQVRTDGKIEKLVGLYASLSGRPIQIENNGH